MNPELVTDLLIGLSAILFMSLISAICWLITKQHKITNLENHIRYQDMLLKDAKEQLSHATAKAVQQIIRQAAVEDKRRAMHNWTPTAAAGIMHEASSLDSKYNADEPVEEWR